MKKKKKLIIIGIIIALILASIISNIIKSVNKEPELDYDIGKIEKQTLRNSISCSGNVKTEDTKNVTSLLVGSKITSVNVKVGDHVEIGDSLVTFDTETLRKAASDLASSINATKEQTNISINGADRAVRDAESARSTNLDQARQAKEQAGNAYNQAILAKDTQTPALQASLIGLEGQSSNYSAIELKYNEAAQKVASAQVTVNNLETQKATLQTQRDSIVALVGGTNAETDSIDLQIGGINTSLVAANTALGNAQTELNTAENAYKNIETQYTTLKEQIQNVSSTIAGLNQAVEQAKSAYEQASKAYDTASSNLDSAILSAKDAAAAARISANTSTLTLEEQLINTNKQLAEGNLKSTVSGTVTAVNVKKGDTYQGGTIVTIEGVENFVVEANVDEYDVADIEEGMEAIIRTDATRDEELTGKVIFVAPSSNESYTTSGATGNYAVAMTGNSGGSNATYQIKIEISDYNERLRLGMSAKVNIITEKAEDVLVVPYDAITEKDNGKKVITVINDDDSQTEIEVEIGIESGYYSEIKSDKIKEGMKIVLPKVNGTSTLDDLLESMGATGGIE